MARDDATLLDIANAARLVQSFIKGMTKEAFLADLKTQSAVLHQLPSSAKRSSGCHRPFGISIPSFRGR
jgi:hypothetical protein